MPRSDAVNENRMLIADLRSEDGNMNSLNVRSREYHVNARAEPVFGRGRRYT